MTTPDPWSDDQLNAAFRARASRAVIPADLSPATIEAVRGRTGTLAVPRPRWRSSLLPLAAAIAVVAVVAGGPLLTARLGSSPTPSPSPSSSLPGDGPVTRSWLLTFGGEGSVPATTLAVTDRTGDVVSARPATLEDRRASGGDAPGPSWHPLGPTSTLITWSGSMCEPRLRLDISRRDGVWLRLSGPVGSACRLALVVRAVVLDWSIPVDDLGVADGRGPDVTPTQFLGLPVIDVEAALAVQARPDDAQEIAVRGWFSAIQPMSCPFTPTTSPVEPACPDPWVVLMAEPESLATAEPDGASGREPTGPSFQLDLDDLSTDWQPGLPAMGPAIPIEIVVLGHFDDRRSFACAPEHQEACRDRFVVDHVAWADDRAQPMSATVDPALATLTVDAARALLGPAIGDSSILSMAVVRGEELGRVEPSLGTGIERLIDQRAVWVVRVLEVDRAVTYLVIDGSDAVYRMDDWRPVLLSGEPPLPTFATPSLSPTPVPSPAWGPWPPEGSVVVDVPTNELDPPTRVAVVDESGSMTAARAVRPGDPAVIDTVGGGDGVLLRDPSTPRRYRLLWGTFFCDRDVLVTISLNVDRIRIEHAPRGGCDAIGGGRELVLEFSSDVDPADVAVEVIRAELLPEDTAHDVPAELFGLPVVTVDEARAIQALPADDREIAVEGALWTSGAIIDCIPMDGASALFYSDCAGWGPWFEAADGDDAFPIRMAPNSAAPSMPGVRMPVVLVGHFDDRRALGCLVEQETACKDVFWVDTAWVNGDPPPRDWTAPTSDEPTPTFTHDEAWRRVADPDAASLIPLSVGLIPGSMLGTLEPASVGHIAAEPWIWHVAALEPSSGRVRTFVIPDSLLQHRDGIVFYEIDGNEVLVTAAIID